MTEISLIPLWVHSNLENWQAGLVPHPMENGPSRWRGNRDDDGDRYSYRCDYIQAYQTEDCCGYRQRRWNRIKAIHIERRARKLLRRFLSSEQLEDFKKYRYFFVTTESGNIYRLGERVEQVTELNATEADKEKLFDSFCYHDREGLPPSDRRLVWKLLLETNETYFLTNANSNPGPAHPDYRSEKMSAEDILAYQAVELEACETENDRIIMRALHLCEGRSEIPPWFWPDDEIPRELVGLHSSWPKEGASEEEIEANEYIPISLVVTRENRVHARRQEVLVNA